MASHSRAGQSPPLLYNPHNCRTSKMYHHIAHASGPATIVAFAGQIGILPDNSIVADPEEQIRQALRNLRKCLDAAGARVSDIIKLTYYIVDFDPKSPLHQSPLYDFLGEHRPPATLVPVPALALQKVIFEIDATVAIPQAHDSMHKFDVVVVGAGLSGLQAAVDLHRAGKRVKVLEARDRVGGKTWSRRAQNSICDVGAAWINDSNQSKVFELAYRLGLTLIRQNVSGNVLLETNTGDVMGFPYGGVPEGKDHMDLIKELAAVRDKLEETCQKIEPSDLVNSSCKIQDGLEKITFENWLQSHGCTAFALDVMKIATRALLGVEPSDLSALYFLDYCKCSGGYLHMRSDERHGGQYLRIKQGTQSLSRGLASELPAEALSLMSPVRRIEQTADGVLVSSTRGVYQASRVIVSVPTPLYKEIEFEPPLPTEKANVVLSTRLGDYCKSIVFYKSPWWRDHGLCGLTQTARGPFAVTRDTSVESDGHYSLTCFVTGQPAREWMVLTRAERDKAVLDGLERIFGTRVEVPKPIEIVEQIWSEEQWSQGCPCPVMTPEITIDAGEVLRAPFERIHFVGTEMAYEWRGYMEGALRSGETGALEVLTRLDKLSE